MPLQVSILSIMWTNVQEYTSLAYTLLSISKNEDKRSGGSVQGEAYVFGRFCEAVLRALGDLKSKKIIPVKNSCNYLQKLIKIFFVTL